MKRRSIVLAASAFALALLSPVRALAGGATTLSVLGVDLLATSSVECGEGTASYDVASNTLTLENATIEASGGSGVQFSGPLTVRLVGANTITAAQHGIYGNGVEEGEVVITGEEGSSLTIESTWEALQVDDTTAPAELVVDGVALDVTSATEAGIVLEGLSLEVMGGATVTSTAQRSAVTTDQSIVVSGEGTTVSVESVSDYGVRAEGDLAVTDATLTAESGSIAAWADGDVVLDDATVTTTNTGTSAPKHNSLNAEGQLTVSGDSVVTARGGILGEKGVVVTPVDGERVDVWVGASEAEAAHYASADGTQKSPFASSVTLNSYDGLSGNAYARVVRHAHSGEPATCTDRAVCEYCGEEYGELDLSNHSWDEPEWRWSADGCACLVTFACELDPMHMVVQEAKVTSVAGKAPTCTEKGTTVYTATTVFEGGDYSAETEIADVAALGHTTELVGAVEPTTGSEGYTGDLVCSVCGETVERGEAVPALPVGTEVMYRLYNRWSGEHFYTGSAEERGVLVDVGWLDEGVAWVAPEEGTPVYRLYNPWVEGGDHHYTTDEAEYEALQELGWVGEGVRWHSADGLDEGAVAILRQYNPYAATGTHNYTASRAENDALVDAGWRHEGVAWYGVQAPAADES